MLNGYRNNWCYFESVRISPHSVSESGTFSGTAYVQGQVPENRGRLVTFSSVSSGITGPAKAKKWEAITSAVNSVSPVVRNVTEIKKKWFDIKMA